MQQIQLDAERVVNDAMLRLEKNLQEMSAAFDKNTNAEAARHQLSFAKVTQDTISYKITDAETRLETSCKAHAENKRSQ